MFDNLLRLLKSSVGNNFDTYADDLLVVIEGDSRRELEIKSQGLSRMINRTPLGRRSGARPDRKLKAVRSSKEDLASRLPTIRLGEQLIKQLIKSEIKYLSTYFDYQMSVSVHCLHLGNKIEIWYRKLVN